MRLALYQPEIALNVGALLRVAACFDAAVDVIEPCGFPAVESAWRRTALDYGVGRELRRHVSFAHFLESAERASGRLLLLSTRGPGSIWEIEFEPSDILMTGQESAGAPAAVHAASDAVLRIPIAATARSLNVATAAAVVLAEARRQFHARERSLAL